MRVLEALFLPAAVLECDYLLTKILRNGRQTAPEKTSPLACQGFRMGTPSTRVFAADALCKLCDAFALMGTSDLHIHTHA